MPSNFDLIITVDYPSRTAELRLLDEHGVQLVYRQTDFKTIAVSRQQGLFDLRNYLHHYVELGREAANRRGFWGRLLRFDLRDDRLRL